MASSPSISFGISLVSCSFEVLVRSYCGPNDSNGQVIHLSGASPKVCKKKCPTLDFPTSLVRCSYSPIRPDITGSRNVVKQVHESFR